MTTVRFTTFDSEGNELKVKATARAIKSYTVTELDLKIRNDKGQNVTLPERVLNDIEEEAEEKLLEAFYSKELEF